MRSSKSGFFRLYVYPLVDFIMSAIVFAFVSLGSVAFVMGLVSLFIAVDAFVLTSLWPIVIPKLLPGLVMQGNVASTVEFSTMFWFLTALIVMKPLNAANIFKKSSKKEQKDDK